MVGFAHAAMAMGGGHSLGITNLRWINPYVVTSFKVTGSPQPRWSVPRAAAGLPLHHASGERMSGVSAYAFQVSSMRCLPVTEPGLPTPFLSDA
jgi:hypothetical protein